MIRHLRNISKRGIDPTGAPANAEERLQDLGNQAWKTYLGIAQTHATPKPVNVNCNNFPADRMMPVLLKIGFEETFVQTLFGLASGAWETLGGIPENVVHLRPGVQHELQEVREGLLIESGRKLTSASGHAFMTPQESFEILQQTMDPANLYLLLDEITTPWIILPRAYTSMQRDHAHYLPAYLEMIDKESNEEVLHIFTRIAIEFLANFSIRYADDQYSKKEVVRLVVAGYEAMFWKNLHSPPRGFEDVRTFEHFFTWLRYSGHRLQKSNPELAETIRIMETQKSHIFPPKSDLHKGSHDRFDSTRLLVALRHGCLGIVCSVRHFWFTPSLTLWPQHTGTEWGTILFALKSLFDLIACRYGSESQRTRYFIREFLFQLQTNCAQNSVHDTVMNKQYRGNRQFVQAKIISMIHQLRHTLSKS